MTYRSEFLRIMADFTSNSCDSNEMIQRMKVLQSNDVDFSLNDDQIWMVDEVLNSTGLNDSSIMKSNEFEDVLEHVNLSNEEIEIFPFLPDKNENGIESDNESSKSDLTDLDDEICWGEVDENFLDIDHRIICDKSNRFLGQWNDKDENISCYVPVTPPRQEENIVPDTTRMVNHILASCLKKRKLHVPYKHQVKLINFNPIKSISTCDDITIRPTTTADPIIMPTNIVIPTILASQTPTMSKSRDVQQLRVGIQPTKDKKIDSSIPRKQPGPKIKTNSVLGEKRKHNLISMSSPSALSFSNSHGTLLPNTSDDESMEVDVMVVDQDILDLGNSITASMSRIVRPKQECLPLPDFGNMPQDLRELKLKIEATENKVEGTKHRHRKGGPCPRCQVQNQLRAAKRALLCRMKRYK